MLIGMHHTPQAITTSEHVVAAVTIEPTVEASAGSRRARKTDALAVTPLRDLYPLLLTNNIKRLDDAVTVYVVVLGFTPSSLTSTQEWNMSIVLIDGGKTDMKNTSADGSQPIVMHILFMKDKSKLPIIQSAGDVICCENRHGAENLSYIPENTSVNLSSFALEANLSLVVNCRAQLMIGRCRVSVMIRGKVSILASPCLEPKSFGSGTNSA